MGGFSRDWFEALLRRLHGLGEAPAGSWAEARLAEEIAREAEAAVGVSARLLPIGVSTWEPGDVVFEACGGRVRGVALPPWPGFVLEDLRVGEGLALLQYRGDPDRLLYEYWRSAVAGAELVVVVLDKPRRLVFQPAPPLPSVPLRGGPPVVGVEAGVAESLMGCGSRVRVESDAALRRSTGYIVEAVEDGAVTVFTAHHDHWLGGAVDDLAGVIQALAASAEARKLGLRTGFVSFTAEELGDPLLRSWYWAYGSRVYAGSLLGAKPGRVYVNFDMALGDVYVTGGLAAGRCIAELLGLEYRGGDVDTDASSLVSAGLHAVTITGFESWLGTYHSGDDAPGLVDAGEALGVARLAAGAAARLAGSDRLGSCALEALRGMIAAAAGKPLPRTRSALYRLYRLAATQPRLAAGSAALADAALEPIIVVDAEGWELVKPVEPPTPPTPRRCPGYGALGNQVVEACIAEGPWQRGYMSWRVLDELLEERLEDAYDALSSGTGSA